MMIYLFKDGDVPFRKIVCWSEGKYLQVDKPNLAGSPRGLS